MKAASGAGRRRGLAGLIGLTIAAAFVLSGCGIAAENNVAPPPEPSASPSPTVSGDVDQTRLQVAGALGAAQFQLVAAKLPFRPPESPRLAGAPRSVFQVVLPNDPTHGYIVIYDFVDTNMAALAGNEMAGYIASGPGSIQFSPDSQFVLRQVGTTLIFYTWSPANSPGPEGGQIETALNTVGTGFAIP